ncbi:MAG: 2-keto-3-deoxygluconate permease [Archaeoglobaceae archaeon]|nr:2-keto-3-deoxygluconate permease [Archaeoglobaceae archaeon]
MIYYLLSLLLGLIVGFLLKNREISTNKPMYAVLVLLIFFLGVSIGNTLNLYELSQVGLLSLVFSTTTIIFSYLTSKFIRRGLKL